MKLAAALLVVAFSTVAAADGERPWVRGVSASQQKTAEELLAAGNSLFLEKKYAEALVKYREAITSWDHPAIRFNIVRCLIQLDKAFDAADELRLALRYGAEPLEDAVYREALAYEKLLANQISTVEVRCTQESLRLTLDGKPVEKCPTSVRVAPGTHQLVGEKPDFITRTLRVETVGGRTHSVEITLVPISKVAKIIHRYPQWIPWTVLGGGILIAGIGGLVQLSASSEMENYERSVAAQCGDQSCTDPVQVANLKEIESRAKFQNKIAITTISIGAAAAITGGVLLYLNRGRTIYEQPRVDVTPSSTGGIVTLNHRF